MRQRGDRVRGARPRHPEQVHRGLGRCGARQDRGPRADRRVHPEAPARSLRDEGTERGGLMDRAPAELEMRLHAPKPMTTVLPRSAPLFTRGGWGAFLTALVAVCAIAPLLNLAVPEGSALHMSDYAVALDGKIMCYA